MMKLISGAEKIKLPEHYTRLGKSYYYSNKMKEAEEALKNGIQIFSQYNFYRSDACAWSYYYLGRTYIALEDDEKALKSFEQAYSILLEIESQSVEAKSKIYN